MKTQHQIFVISSLKTNKLFKMMILASVAFIPLACSSKSDSECKSLEDISKMSKKWRQESNERNVWRVLQFSLHGEIQTDNVVGMVSRRVAALGNAYQNSWRQNTHSLWQQEAISKFKWSKELATKILSDGNNLTQEELDTLKK